MNTLREETIKNIELIVGKPYSEICEMTSATDVGVDVRFSRKKPFVAARGNPYLADMRFSTVEEADKRMMKLIGETRRERKSRKRNRRTV